MKKRVIDFYFENRPQNCVFKITTEKEGYVKHILTTDNRSHLLHDIQNLDLCFDICCVWWRKINSHDWRLWFVLEE